MDMEHSPKWDLMLVIHGFTSSMPVISKSVILRVASVRSWTFAVAAIRESLGRARGKPSVCGLFGNHRINI